MMAINTHVLQAAPIRLVTRVTALTTAAQQVMVSFAVAGLTGFLASRISYYSTAAPEGNPLDSMQSAFSDTFLFAAGIALLGLILGIFLRRPAKQIAEEEIDGEQPLKSEPSMMMGH